MKLLEIFHSGKDEYGNDLHSATIELDDGSLVYIPARRGGVEFENNYRETHQQSDSHCPNCNARLTYCVECEKYIEPTG